MTGETNQQIIYNVEWQPAGGEQLTDSEASPAEIDAAPRREGRDLIRQVEGVDWTQVPGVSVATAAAFAAGLEQALEGSR